MRAREVRQCDPALGRPPGAVKIDRGATGCPAPTGSWPGREPAGREPDTLRPMAPLSHRPDALDLSGQGVLVTGASRGIGRAIAQRFARHGATVAVHCNANRAAAEETLALLEGGGHVVVEADMADPEAVRAMVDRSVTALGRLDVLVNNAGIFEPQRLVELTYEEWQEAWTRTLAVNLTGAANALWCAARHMIDHGGGRIVNVTSRGAFRGEPNSPAYGASKAGLNSLGQSMAQALAPHGIYVTTVAPGFVATDMTNDLLDGPEGAGIRGQSPLGRTGLADEVAYVVAFLASPGAEYATGTIVDVNGASYLRS
jgi:3-oxoacyl-[acyl-carrier protein] reductase